MIAKFLKSFLAVGFAVLLVLLFVFFLNYNFSHAAGNANVAVSIADLKEAGFTKSKLLPPANGRFAGPNLYFSVSDKVLDASSEAPNVVMVEDLVAAYPFSAGALFSYGVDSHDFAVAGGSAKEASMADGRSAINVVKGNHYLVLIGPNQAKIEKLALRLAAKIQ